MIAPSRLELADVVRRHAPDLLASRTLTLQPEQRRALTSIAACRTSALGAHLSACSACDHREIAYNSCRNRHCPKCQAAARARWVEARERDLLPVAYFHVVFTLPDPLATLALANKRVVYDLLMTSAWEAMRSIAAEPKHLGAEIGALAILHTWGQTLVHHPHVHCVVPGGGLSADGSRWVSCRKRFFLSVRVLSRRFRTLMLDGLRRAHAARPLVGLETAEALARLTAELRRVEWVVYAKRPFGGPRQVLRYLGRYTHRVAIANRRLVALGDGRVTFTYKDYRHHNAERRMTLEASEFLRRFLLHVLPRGFKRIRSYGLLANRTRREKLAACRRLLGGGTRSPIERVTSLSPETASETTNRASTRSEWRCPACGAGWMRCIEVFGVAGVTAQSRAPPT
jgi:hypothetical protein